MQKLKPMEEQKYLYFDSVHRRLLVQQSLEDYMKFLQNKEFDIRCCYLEKFPKLDQRVSSHDTTGCYFHHGTFPENIQR